MQWGPVEQQWYDPTASADTRDSGRSYADPATGTRWRATETAASTLMGHEGARCLVFASDMVIRRVWTYPPAWRDLSAAELTVLSWGT